MARTIVRLLALSIFSCLAFPSPSVAQSGRYDVLVSSRTTNS